MLSTTQTLPKELESTATIRFQDCDPFGHLNNARYIDYFINARLDQVADFYDFHIFDRIGTDHENWVVTQTQIRYLLPARFNQQVRIRTRLIDLSERTIMIEAMMLSPDGRHLLALAWVEFVIVDTDTGRPVRHSQELMDFFNAMRVDESFDRASFETRVQDLKKQLRVEQNV